MIGTLYQNLKIRSLETSHTPGILTGDSRPAEVDFFTRASGWFRDASKKIVEVEEELWQKWSWRS